MGDGTATWIQTLYSERKESFVGSKEYPISNSEEGQSEYVYLTWTNDTKSNYWWWGAIVQAGRVTKVSIGDLYLRESSLLIFLCYIPLKRFEVGTYPSLFLVSSTLASLMICKVYL